MKRLHIKDIWLGDIMIIMIWVLVDIVILFIYIFLLTKIFVEEFCSKCVTSEIVTILVITWRRWISWNNCSFSVKVFVALLLFHIIYNVCLFAVEFHKFHKQQDLLMFQVLIVLLSLIESYRIHDNGSRCKHGYTFWYNRHRLHMRAYIC